MQRTWTGTLSICSACLIGAWLVSACSGPAPAPSEAPIASAAQGASPNALAARDAERRPRPRACELVPAEMMSAILGGKVDAQPISAEGGGKTDCEYHPANGISPTARVEIEWGSGEVAMTAMGMLNNVEKGMTNPYEGLGDEAVAIGPSMMIRHGEHLVTVFIMAEGDHLEQVRRIYETLAKSI